MTHIRPISDLRNRAVEISELCHEEDQPVFITQKGKGDLVDIFEYIKKDRPDAAISMLEKFDTSISLLESNPFLGVIPNL
jgi:hypothetical protein